MTTTRERRLDVRWVGIGDIRVRWLEAGSGPPVVLLHGLAGSRRWWGPTIPALAPRHRVLVPELFALRRGRRRYRPPPVPLLARLVVEWLRGRATGPVALVGHSMGGHLSLHVVAQHPGRVRQLILVNSTGIPRESTHAELARLARGLLPLAAWGTPRFLPTIGLDSLRAGLISVGASLRSLLRDDVRPILPRITLPTDVIWGELDPFIPLSSGEELARHIPGAHLHVVPGAAHNPMIDRPAAFNEILLEILTRPRT